MLCTPNMECIAHQYGVLCTPIYVCYAHQKWCAQHTLYGVPVWTVLAHQIWCAYHTKFFRVFSRPKILFLVSLLFVALLNPKFNPYLLFKFLIFYYSSCIIGLSDYRDNTHYHDSLGLFMNKIVDCLSYNYSLYLY